MGSKYIFILIVFFTFSKVSANSCVQILHQKHLEKYSLDSLIENLKIEIEEVNSDFNFSEWSCKKRTLAIAYQKKRFYKLALEQLISVSNHINFIKTSDYSGIVYVEIANTYKSLAEYEKSLEFLLKSLEIFENNKSWKLLCETYVILGEFYRKIGDYSSSKISLKKALLIYNQNKGIDESLYYRTLGRKAAVYNETNVLDSAISTSYLVLSFGQKSENKDLQATAHNEIGYSYLNLNLPDSSIFHYQKAEQLWLEINDLESAVHAKTNRAICVARNEDDDTSAIKILYEIEKFIIDNNLDYPLHNIYLHLSTEYKHMNEYDSIIKYVELFYGHLRLNEMKINEEKISEVKESYQNKKLLDEKESINQSLINTKKLLEEKNIILIIIFVFSIVVFILVLILLNLFIKTRHSKKELAFKNEEKDILIKEINHRVKNNMQMVSSLLALQEGKTLDINSKNTLISASDRINALSLAHQQIYLNDDYKNINLKVYLQSIFEKLTFKTGIEYDIEIADALFFDIEKGQAVGFIVNELITNSIKYAWQSNSTPKKIKLKVTGDSKKGTIEFQDNGVGLVFKNQFETINSLGFSLIKSFAARQLKGKIDVENNGGVKYTIHYKI